MYTYVYVYIYIYIYIYIYTDNNTQTYFGRPSAQEPFFFGGVACLHTRMHIHTHTHRHERGDRRARASCTRRPERKKAMGVSIIVHIMINSISSIINTIVIMFVMIILCCARKPERKKASLVRLPQRSTPILHTSPCGGEVLHVCLKMARTKHPM